MKQIGQGRTADIFETQENKIIKLYKMGFPQDAINQEYLISKFVYALGIHTPEPFELIQQDNRQGIIYRRIIGSTLLQMMSKSPWSIKKFSKKLAALHYELHSYDASGVLSQQKKVLANNIQGAPFLSELEKSRIRDYLESLPEGNLLCHGDFHPDNVLIGEESWIIDWMTGTAGNPAGDAARSVILFEYGTMPEGTPRLIKAAVSFLRNKIRKVYIKHYLDLSQMKYSDIDNWILPVAAARLVEWIPQEEQDKLLLVIRERLMKLAL
ncbi:hypothetical protein EHS13_11460 [Paenibacillus psychroresistens]|uniref:Aminoglycoside phosphotransferase domain-containing protein n=1 Tax=Paenibacillus psychroresistens TaxID=1778678 RepID=A0A6B8RJ91_9BACL|nr:aminoglycoside phosphotransferase family protein [Paenibacillus psychroresistens]QGQ95456.1 hypothetical protein EHS13_11460 [Paenibacillus psychroresistens]